jgi:hypothetical protein
MPFPFLAALPAVTGVLSRLLGGGAKGAATERGNQNDFQQRQNQLELQRYGTNQNALLQALLAQDRGAMDRYGTQQAATTNALNSGSQEASSRYNTRQGATSRALESQSQEGMQRAQLGLQAPNVRARQSILGSLMQNMQPVSIETNERVRGSVPKISGGLTPAALDPTTRQHGGALMQAALQAQLTGSDVPKATNFMGGVLDAPAATDFRSGILQTPETTDFRSGVLTPPEMGGYRRAGRGESLLSGGSMVGGILSELLPFILQGRGGGRDASYEEDFG